MKKKEIVTLALTTALLMTAHAVPASAASNAPESMSQQVRYKPLLPDGKAPMLLSRLSQSLASRFLCRYTFHQKNRRHHP